MILDECQVEVTETLRSPEKNLSNFDLKVENGKLRADNMELQYRVDKLNKKLEENNDSEDSDDEIFDMDVEIDEKDEKDDKDTRVNNILKNGFV
ncbi:hypothetical protein C1646_774772 [Rhizophagus diaphanus]|nr:hypothetical protein C1646_774772 [Rhizophagus diaphanus] [Rhizophagus sp. MUCL 43196]